MNGRRGTMPEEDLRHEASFLLARLRDFEADGITDDNAREWFGHVQPSMERLQALCTSPAPALAAPIPSGSEGFPDEAVQAALKVWHATIDDANVDDEPDDLEHAAMEFALLEADKIRSGLAAPIPSERWRAIETAPQTTDPILLCGWLFADDAWNIGYLNGWQEAPEGKAKERYQCIGYMVQPPSGHRCVGHRNGPVNITHWRPLPAPPGASCDEQSKTEDRDSGLSPKDASAVGEAETPQATPQDLPPMTVEEARETLRSLGPLTPERWIQWYQSHAKICDPIMTAEYCLFRASRIETALRILSQRADVEVKP